MSIVFWKDLEPGKIAESETAKACLSLLKKRMNNTITEQEFASEMHYVTLFPACLKDHEFEAAPPKTIEVQKALEALESEKQNLRDGEFVDMAAFNKAFPCILGHSEKEEAIIRRNKRNAQSLEDDYAFFKKLGDTLSAMKIYEAYMTYPPSLWSGKQCIWKRRTL